MIVKSLSYILLLMVPEQVSDWHFCSYGCVIFVFFCFLSSLVWFFLWLPEEVLTFLFLLHFENGDFSILMKDIVPISILDKISVYHSLQLGKLVLFS